MVVLQRACPLLIVVVLMWASVLVGGCASAPAAVDGAGGSGGFSGREAGGPDPSVRVVIGESPLLIEQPRGMGMTGMEGLYEVRGTRNQLTVFFEAKAGEAHHKDLVAYCAWAEDAFKDREIRRVDVGSRWNPAREAGFAYAASSYVNVRRPGGPAPKSICDAAGFRFETPGGFWTISCNSDLGKIAEALPALDECLRVMTITRTGAR